MSQTEEMQAANLRALGQEFFTPAAKRARRLAESMIDKKGYGKLPHLMRHHEEESITNKETWIRDDFDYLLAYYSVLEIAALIKFIKVNPEEPAFVKAIRILECPPIRRYYSKHYRVVLPQLFRERLKGNFSKHEQDDRSVGLFYSFLPLVKLIEQDADLETFLWFLDGGTRGRYSYRDVAKVFRKHERFLRCVTSSRPSHLDKGIWGFVKFLRFCEEFDCLLREASDAPWLQAEMFAYHSYWFVQCKSKLGKRIYDGVETLNKSMLKFQGIQADIDTSFDSRERKRFNSGVLAAIRRLLSGTYNQQLAAAHINW